MKSLCTLVTGQLIVNLLPLVLDALLGMRTEGIQNHFLSEVVNIVLFVNWHMFCLLIIGFQLLILIVANTAL